MIEVIIAAIVVLVVSGIICCRSVIPCVRDTSVFGASIRCPSCGECVAYSIEDASEGGNVFCTACGHRIQIVPLHQHTPDCD